MNLYLCRQTGVRVIAQPAHGHARIALTASRSIRTLADLLTSDHWTTAERDEIVDLIEGNRLSMIAHANAIIAGAFH